MGLARAQLPHGVSFWELVRATNPMMLSHHSHLHLRSQAQQADAGAVYIDRVHCFVFVFYLPGQDIVASRGGKIFTLPHEISRNDSALSAHWELTMERS